MQSKLPNIGTTIFTVMSALANEHNAVNLGQGFPDFPMDPQLISLANDAMKNNHNQYTHMFGNPILREKLAKKINTLYHQEIDSEKEITITPGATYALFTAITTFINEGDEVIAFEPAYDCYKPAIELNKGKYIAIHLNNDFSIPWSEVQQKINNRTRAIIINTPHNPSGYVWTKADIRELEDLTRNTNILVISDEVYEHIIFDNKPHESVLNSSELFKRSIACYSFGKTYHCTGWKIGYAVAKAEHMSEFRKVHQFNAFCVDSPKQVALANYIDHSEAYLGLGNFLQKKRDYFRALMSASKFMPMYSQGSYFECYRYDAISNMNDKDFAIKLVSEYGVAAIPVSAFYSTGKETNILRFCFAKSEETLEKAVERLLKVQ